MNPTGLIPALDSDDRSQILDWAATLAPESTLLKVGLQAFVAHGQQLVRDVVGHAPVFLDLKLHDIPNTVAGAARAVGDLGVSMLTVHASGGAEMIAAAVDAAPDVSILAVTVLTSLGPDALGTMGHPSAEEQVPRLASLAVDAGRGRGGLLSRRDRIRPCRDRGRSAGRRAGHPARRNGRGRPGADGDPR